MPDYFCMYMSDMVYMWSFCTVGKWPKCKEKSNTILRDELPYRTSYSNEF